MDEISTPDASGGAPQELSRGASGSFSARWLSLAPPLLLMAGIFWAGGGQASADETRSLLTDCLRAWFPALYARLSPEALVIANVALRKAGHFLAYALLGFLNMRAAHSLAAGPPRRRSLLAWGAAVAWAAVDEFHQSFSPSRGASAGDVALDAAGAAAGAALYLLRERARWKV